MKEIEKDKICYYCLGCNKLESESYIGTRNCKRLVPVVANWHELFIKEVLKNK